MKYAYKHSKNEYILTKKHVSYKILSLKHKLIFIRLLFLFKKHILFLQVCIKLVFLPAKQQLIVAIN